MLDQSLSVKENASAMYRSVVSVAAGFLFSVCNSHLLLHRLLVMICRAHLDFGLEKTAVRASASVGQAQARNLEIF